MLKKTVVLGSLVSLFFVNSAYAETPQIKAPKAEAPCFQSGFLGGGAVPYANTTGFSKGGVKNGFPEAPGFASGGASQGAGLIGVIGGYRFIFDQGATVGMDVAANTLLGSDGKKSFNQPRSLFDNRLTRGFNVVPSLNFGKVLFDQFHIALGLGVGIAHSTHSTDNVAKNLPVSSSQTTVGFVPSVGAEYAWTKNISFIGNVSYEMYRKVNSTFGQKMDPTMPGSRYWSAIKPKYLAPKAGIIYRF